MNIKLTKEQQLQLIKANKFFKLKMLKDNFTEEQARVDKNNSFPNGFRHNVGNY